MQLRKEYIATVPPPFGSTPCASRHTVVPAREDRADDSSSVYQGTLSVDVVNDDNDGLRDGEGPTTEGLELEMGLKRQTRHPGTSNHFPPGSKERRETVNLGHAAKEVIVIEWLDEGPEVSHPISQTASSDSGADISRSVLSEPIQLAKPAQMAHHLHSHNHQHRYRSQLFLRLDHVLLETRPTMSPAKLSS